MQPDQLTLAVDPLNDGTIVPEVFSRYDRFANRTVYIGEGHLPDARNTLSMYRSFATKSGNFNGTSKSAVKFSRDIGVPGADGVSTLTAPVIIDISFSVPVGTPAAVILAMRQAAIALLDDDAVMVPLNSQLMV